MERRLEEKAREAELAWLALAMQSNERREVCISAGSRAVTIHPSVSIFAAATVE